MKIKKTYSSKLMIFIFSISLLALVSCGERKIEGEFYIKTNSGVKKIVDEEISILDKSIILNSKEEIIRNSLSLLNVLNNKIAEIEENKKKLDELVKISQNIKKSENWYKSKNPELTKEADNLINEIADQLNLASKINAGIKEELVAGNAAEIYAKANFLSSHSTQKVRTDSDGKYKISITGSEDKVLIASAENRNWMIKVAPGVSKVSLTESNEFRTHCQECLIPVNDIPTIQEAVISALKNNSKVSNNSSNNEINSDISQLIKNSELLYSQGANISKKVNSAAQSLAMLSLLSVTPGSIRAEAELKNQILEAKILVIKLQEQQKNISLQLIEQLKRIKSHL